MGKHLQCALEGGLVVAKTRSLWQRTRLSGWQKAKLAADYLAGRHQLPNVALRVLGGVEQQTQYRGREPRAADASRLEQRRLAGCPQLRQRALDRCIEPGGERGGGIGCEIRHFLHGKRGHLRWQERLAPRIGEQAVEAGRRVARVKADRRGAVRTLPQLLRREPGKRNGQLFAAL